MNSLLVTRPWEALEESSWEVDEVHLRVLIVAKLENIRNIAGQIGITSSSKFEEAFKLVTEALHQHFSEMFAGASQHVDSVLKDVLESPHLRKSDSSFTLLKTLGEQVMQSKLALDGYAEVAAETFATVSKWQHGVQEAGNEKLCQLHERTQGFLDGVSSLLTTGMESFKEPCLPLRVSLQVHFECVSWNKIHSHVCCPLRKQIICVYFVTWAV